MTSIVKKRWILVHLGIAILFLGLPVGAQVYSFEDAEGVVHFTNVPNDNRYQVYGQTPDDLSQEKAASNKKYDPRQIPMEYQEYIEEASERYNIPQSLIRAVMAVESNFNPQAVSVAGAQGLMQLMPATAREMGVLDSFDPRQNILGGTRYLRLMANAFDGDLVLTLAAYNAGHQAVTRHMDIPPFAETQRYVRRVLRLYYSYKRHMMRSVSTERD